jgi:hypothetical protein
MTVEIFVRNGMINNRYIQFELIEGDKQGESWVDWEITKEKRETNLTGWVDINKHKASDV